MIDINVHRADFSPLLVAQSHERNNLLSELSVILDFSWLDFLELQAAVEGVSVMLGVRGLGLSIKEIWLRIWSVRFFWSLHSY